MDENAEKAAVEVTVETIAAGHGLRNNGLASILGEGLRRLWNIEPHAEDSAIRKRVMANFDRLIATRLSHF